MKSRLIGKDPEAGESSVQEEKGVTEDEMIDGIISSMDISFRKCWEIVKDKESQRAAVHGATNRHHLMTEQHQCRWPFCVPKRLGLLWG